MKTMKHGTKPTVAQCELLRSWGIRRPEDWLIERDTPEETVIVHRYVDLTKRIPKKGAEDE
jgi:hypothetical protein